MEDLAATEARLRQLMMASLAGDSSSYRVLLVDLRQRLRRFFRRRLQTGLSDQVEDLVQETLLALHARRMTYDSRQPFTAWVFAIAQYKLIDCLRTAKQQQIFCDSNCADLLAPESHALNGERLHPNDLESMLSKLPSRIALLVRWVKLEGRSINEAAADCSMTPGAARTAIHRALKQLSIRYAER